LSEVIAEAFVRRIVAKKYESTADTPDVQTLYYDHFSYQQRLLPLLQAALQQ
jgi:hypothetical protein